MTSAVPSRTLVSAERASEAASRARTALGFTPRELAMLTGIDEGKLAAYELGGIPSRWDREIFGVLEFAARRDGFPAILRASLMEEGRMVALYRALNAGLSTASTPSPDPPFLYDVSKDL